MTGRSRGNNVWRLLFIDQGDIASQELLRLEKICEKSRSWQRTTALPGPWLFVGP